MKEITIDIASITAPVWGAGQPIEQRAAFGRPETSPGHFTNGKFELSASVIAKSEHRGFRIPTHWPWVPTGTPVVVGGIAIETGLFYLREMDDSSLDCEPSLVDPQLGVEAGPVGAVEGSSYASFSPTERHAYLSWIASGRPLPAPAAFVRLAVIGFERRILADTGCDRDERLLLGGELEWLATSGSAAARALRDLAFATLPDDILLATEPVFDDLSWNLAGAVVLASCRTQAPLPPLWAAAAALCSPGQTSSALASSFSHPEVRELFAPRYAARFPGGVVGKSHVETIEVRYVPINPSIAPVTPFSAFLRVQANAEAIPVRDILACGQACVSALSSYLRVARATSSSRAVALLPYEVAATVASEETERLVAHVRELCSDGPAAMTAAEIFGSLWPCPQELRSRGVVRTLSRVLSDRGWGIEPDPTVAPWPRMPRRFAFFQIGERHEESLEFDWKRATILLLGDVCNALALGEVFTSSVIKTLGLDPVTDSRLVALCRTYPGTFLDVPDRFLKDVRVAAAVRQVLSDVGAHLGGREAAAFKTVLARQGIALIPAPERTPNSARFELRKEVLVDLAEQDRVIGPRLAGLSDQLEALAESAPATLPVSEDTLARDLVTRLPTTGSISAAAFAELCLSARRAPSVTLELINSFAVAHCGEPLLEGGDPIVIDRHVQNFIKGR